MRRGRKGRSQEGITEKEAVKRGREQRLTGGLNDLVLVRLSGVVVLASVVHSSLQHLWISFILNNNSIIYGIDI